jgi:hypothetical protein
VASDTIFAIRGGGHQPTTGDANTDHGVLIAMTLFDEMTVVPTPNKFGEGYFRCGAGNRFGDIYDFLNPYGLSIVGGRVYPVGQGAVLGGGMSFLSNEQGWAVDNVVNYEVVTAKGEILQVNPKTYPDLFWAVGGGGNNFGVVTRFDLKTFEQDQVWGGSLIYTADAADGFLDAYTAWMAPGGGHEDAKGFIMPSFRYTPSTQVKLPAFVGLYNAPVEAPVAFENFSALPTDVNGLGIWNFSQVVDQTKTGYGDRIFRYSLWTHLFPTELTRSQMEMVFYKHQVQQ